jgi:hypothetical protein
MFSSGLHLSGSWHPLVPTTDVASLAQHTASVWSSNVAMTVRVTPPGRGRVEPFGALRAGWLVSTVSHGPMVGFALGADVHITARVALGLSLDAQAAFVSAVGWPQVVNGYALRQAERPDWGTTWRLTGFGSGFVHLRISL